MELKEAKRQFKSIGFKLRVKSLSFGRHVDVVNSKGESLPEIFFGDSHREQWVPALTLKASCGPLEDKGEHLVGFGKA